MSRRTPPSPRASADRETTRPGETTPPSRVRGSIAPAPLRPRDRGSVVRAVPTARDRGSITPLIAGLTILAAVVVTATIAASGAFLAHRDLSGLCDGAALAAAAAATRPAPDGTPVLDPTALAAEIERYRTEVAESDPSLALDPSTDGRVVTVVCTRRTEIPFGTVLGAPHGLDRTVVARAGPVTR